MSRIPGPSQLRDAYRNLREIKRGGGPARVRLNRIERPSGKLFPTSTADMEIETRDGDTLHLRPDLPIPLPYTWGYRVARKLGVPVVSGIEPSDLSFSVPVPGWMWPGD